MSNHMNTASSKKRIALIPAIVLLLCAFLFIGQLAAPKSLVQATSEAELQEELERLQRELEEIQRQKQQAQNALNAEKNKQGSLTSQISILAAEIAEKEIEIKEVETEILKNETQIKILEEEITDTQKSIENLEKKVSELEAAASEILKAIYIDSKTHSFIDILLDSEESESFISQVQYHTALGTHDQNTLAELQQDRTQLEEAKIKLESDKLETEKLAEMVSQQKEDLEKQKESLNSQIAQKNKLLQDSKIASSYYGQEYNNLSDDQKRKEAEMDYIIQLLANTSTKPKGYVVKGQAIATEASNGCSTGPDTHFGIALNDANPYISSEEWVDPCTYATYRLPYYGFGWGSCGSGSTNDADDSKPRYPYAGTFYSSRGYSWYHKALDLYAGYGRTVYAAHDGYYFEEPGSCSNSWCSVGCKSATNPCVKVCKNYDCTNGPVSIYCHVNFL